MREILFRGKRKDNGKWLYGSLVQHFESVSIIDEYNPFFITEVISKTVGQYTGLHDMNGTKIFEGDIVSFADCWDTQHKGIVCWRSGSYDVDCSKSDKDIFRLFTAYACGAEIIGNIHDNPELLGGERNATD